MANWKHTLDFKPFWNNDEIDIKAKADFVVKELKRLQRHFLEDLDLELIIEDFEDVGGDCEPPETSETSETSEFTITEDFDARMYELYDWADSNLVWVSTF